MIRGVASVAFVLLGLIAACSSDPAAGDGGEAVPNPDGKPAKSACKKNDECASLKCESGKCTAVAGANPDNKKKDGDESDVDCGGKSAPACADGKACTDGADCESNACKAGKCASPSPDDGEKNGDETDVDCGGSKAPKCAAGKGCETNADCASDACAYDKKCVEFKSCTGHFGGDTCGPGETGEAEAKHESCCTVVTSQGIKVGKYQVTAGRVRAFLERHNGNLKQWAATDPKGWNHDWDDQLPASADDALEVMGPAGKRGCRINQSGGGSRTYWTPEREYADGDVDKQEYTKDVLDEKAANCIPWHIAQAVCVSDGGRLMSSAELKKLRTNGGSTTWPWGNTPGFKLKQQGNPANHFYAYQRPARSGDDQACYVSPPGRFTDGANNDGVEDLLGNVMPWVNDSVQRFAWTSSWEEHPPAGLGSAPETQTWPKADGQGPDKDGYWAIGFRCVFE